ncbi:MAG: hypothetical protein HOP16_05130 [Acidobacteria bacterium]|nr:hypothetical protein [Acidobacteriota bacterium]
MYRHVLAAGSVMLMTGSLLFAQGGPPPPPIDIIGIEPLEFGEAVTGAPFSAEAISETRQEFTDGNRIERRTMSSIARDGAGRVRREQALPQLGPVVVEPELRMITITDPGQRALYIVDPARRTVSKSMMPPPRRPRGEPNDPRREGSPRLPPPRITSENLGSMEVAGVRAEGTRQTMTIPAGVFGNVRPIDVVTERWFSPDLKIVVESRRTDPRTGEVVYRVVNLVRGEPSPDLFEVPADYSVMDRPQPRPLPRPPLN